MRLLIEAGTVGVRYSGVTRMARRKDTKYDAYAKHRILHRLLELFPTYGNWEDMARAVSEVRGIHFHRTDFNRIRNDDAGDAILDRVVVWLETLQPDFRERLSPETIFSEVGVSARDYYFHLFTMANLDEWDKNLLMEFEGIYLCAPEGDANSYLPSPYVRACLDKTITLPPDWLKGRSVDIRDYITKRSFLILRRTGAHFYHAAEVPLGAFFPQEFQALDPLCFYEGVGIASSNTIHVFLRECLSRVPKFHSILIQPKSAYQIPEIDGMKLYATAEIRFLKEEWARLSPEMIDHRRREFARPIASDLYLRGTGQTNMTPIAWARNRVGSVFGMEQVYHRKPRHFMRDPATHFIRPDLDIGPELEKLAANPLIADMFA